MIYNEFQGLKLSRLGFGCMRFAKDPSTGAVDQQKVNDMFGVAIAGGVNYFDTAYPYVDGLSEAAVAEALSKYPRESYFLADKFPGHSLPGPVDNIALFNLELERCRTDYFDFYLLHNINEWSIRIYESEEYHILPDILKMKEQGKIRHLGFSFHGGPELLESFLSKNEGVFEFVQIQCNYLDWTLQKAKEKYDIITRHGLGVWIMEPCRGGKLASLPGETSAKLRAFDSSVSDASWAFRFLQQLPNVKMILSGMNEVFQVEDNLKSFESERVLTGPEQQTLLEIAEGMKQGVPCTACRYCCAGCPVGLNIPLLLDCYNSMKTPGGGLTSSMRLDGLAPEQLPSACIGCRQCEHACPQGIHVPEALAELDTLYKTGLKWQDAARSRHEAIRRDLKMD